MATAFSILIFFAVIALTALIFGGWVIFSIIRLIFCALSRLFDPPRRTPVLTTSTEGICCINERCRGNNPPDARFCRRCGRSLPPAQHVAVRRAAVW